MPIYLYECSECDGSEEHVQKFSDPPVTVCESCGGKRLNARARGSQPTACRRGA